jgi:calcineurin-like phosphoesterase family protein
MKVFFTADLHFGHSNIIKHCKRPFMSVEDMDDTLIDNWNAVVSNKDAVYICGDVGMHKPDKLLSILWRLNGIKHLVFGNHDSNIRKSDSLLKVFASAEDYKMLKLPDTDAADGHQRIVLFHYPITVWDRSHYGVWHLHGHCHGTLKDGPSSLRLDVGVDAWYVNNIKPYRPIEYSEIKEKMKGKKWEPKDYHKRAYGEGGYKE